MDCKFVIYYILLEKVGNSLRVDIKFLHYEKLDIVYNSTSLFPKWFFFRYDSLPVNERKWSLLIKLNFDSYFMSAMV